ncbi:hypothetical protein AB4483_09195 [Vibrio splendidus]
MAKKKLQSRRLAKPVLSWTEVKLITSRRHRIEGVLSFGVSTISRQQVLPEYERIWEQTIVEEAYQQAIGELLEQGDVVLRVEDSMGFSFIRVFSFGNTFLISNLSNISVKFLRLLQIKPL